MSATLTGSMVSTTLPGLDHSLLGAPLAWKLSKNPSGMENQTLCWKIVQSKNPCGVEIQTLCWKIVQFCFFSHITVWGSCFSLCTRLFRVRPPCRITTHHNITYHITTSLVTSQHHLSHLTHHSTSSHSCTVTAHSSQHKSSHSCTAQLITQLWQHNSSSHSCTAHTAALHNSSHHL